MTINNSTRAANRNSGAGGGSIARNSGALTINNTIVQGANSAECSGAVAGGSNNIGSDTSCGAGFTVTDPLLGPLQDNRGVNPTWALLAGSPAINAGNNAACAAIDQRGVPRIDGACDIGAFEVAVEQTGPIFTVTTAADTAAPCLRASCSLRAAITVANTTPNGTGPDTIVFAIPGAGVQTIRPNYALPSIAEAVIIDGYTQPGAAPNTLETGSNAVIRIEIDGSIASSADPALGLDVLAGGTTIRDLAIGGFGNAGGGGYGIALRSPTNAVEGCFLGTDASGTAARANDYGVFIGDSDNQVGGSAPVQRNVISGNGGGVLVFSSALPIISGDIRGNLIGTNAAGNAPLPNVNYGIVINTTTGAVSGITIGGTTPGARNVISGNLGNGIAFTEAGATGNLVQGNYIGVNAFGNDTLKS